MKTPTLHFRPQNLKKFFIIVGSVLVGGAIITYAGFSYFHWNSLKTQADQVVPTLKNTLESSLGSDSGTVGAQGSIDSTITKFTASYGQVPCRSTFWFNWQTILPPIKALKQDCEAQFALTHELTADLKTLSQFMKDEKLAADLLNATIQATKTPTDYTAASTIWLEMSRSDKLSSSSEFKPVKDVIVSTAASVSDAYTALALATEKQKRTDFDAAYSQLQAAYQDLAKISPAATAEQAKLTLSLSKSYEEL